MTNTLVSFLIRHGSSDSIIIIINISASKSSATPYLPYLTSGVDRLLHLPSAEAVSARPNARPRM